MSSTKTGLPVTSLIASTLRWLAHYPPGYLSPRQGSRKGHHNIFLLTAQACGGTHDGLYRFDVARAAAQVARESITHLLFGWVRIPLQQGIGREQHARRTEPALHRTQFDKRFLQWVELLCRPQALCRHQRAATSLCCQHDATRAGHTIDEHGAGTTLTSLTPMLHTKIPFPA